MKLTPTAEQMERAKARLEEKDFVNKRTVNRDPTKKLAGHIAEIVIADHFGWEAANEDTDPGYDLISNNGKRIDVKCTADYKIIKDNYDRRVDAYQVDGIECDYYLFTSYHRPTGDLYLLGGMSKQRFMEEAELVKAGQPRGGNNMRFKNDIYFTTVSELDKF